MAASSSDSGKGAAWHRALAYAITGIRMDDLGRQSRPDLPALAAEITRRMGGIEELRAEVRKWLDAGGPWPYPVPDDLREGLGAAQWLAALTGLRQRLELDPQPSRPVITDRAPDTAERRLLEDVPPHHGR
jgi:hypothetical protein